MYLRTKDYLVSGEIFDLVLDQETQMLVTTPQPKPEDLSKYYESESYISHTDSNKGIVSYCYQIVKKYSLKKKLKLINRFQTTKGLILDIGAGTGEFLKEADNNGWEIYGIEPSPKARELAKNKNVFLSKEFGELPDKKFDVITLWHVLEHLPSLDEEIKKIESFLKPSGILIIAVPNYKSYDAKFYKKHWAAYDVPRHLWHFSQQSMKLLFSKNLKLVRIQPMIFDSFYVSLLSEKYKTGNSFSVRAFFVGLWSNIKAWSSTEYSSLIYCYKKEG
ncbi:class I SAM-dependent methyltransferase [Jejudonia soesokkakensis]|uniref:Class I SAM-dependent methyltransferase n=1 Tax=Jejudonia soesokkakensis TaxID=1323432 RepID=A0ABW2MRH8_9FLAO